MKPANEADAVTALRDDERSDNDDTQISIEVCNVLQDNRPKDTTCEVLHNRISEPLREQVRRRRVQVRLDLLFDHLALRREVYSSAEHARERHACAIDENKAAPVEVVGIVFPNLHEKNG